MEEIYIIMQPTGSYDTYYARPVAWVETEEEAKTYCEALDASIPKCPLHSQKLIDQMEDLLYDWSDFKAEYLDSHESPYTEPIDDSGLRKVTDYEAHSKWVDNQNKELELLRIEWFEKNGPAQKILPAEFTWISFLKAWDEWKDELYQETGKSFYHKLAHA